MHGGFQMVARIPYPATVPKHYTLVSEVATMTFLRSSVLSIPHVYGYSPTPDNGEFVRSNKLSDVWLDLGGTGNHFGLAPTWPKTMSISFPAGGSLYCVQDLEKVAGGSRISLEDERFCVDPDARLLLRYGRGSQLEVGRGPRRPLSAFFLITRLNQPTNIDERAEAALVRAVHKELAYLEQFGRLLLLFQRVRREGYRYQEQSPSDHSGNLDRYLPIISSLIPRDPALSHFRICHSDLRQNNEVVSRSPDSN